MREALPQILGILVLVSVPLTGLCLGIETGRAYLSQLWRMPRVLVRFFLATFVLMPALAVVIRLSENLPPAVWAGLLLISMTPASPGFYSKANRLSADAEISLAWQLTSVLLSIVTIPLNAADCGGRNRVAAQFGNKRCNEKEFARVSHFL
jgi:predicted Na+-dependent transporter